MHPTHAATTLQIRDRARHAQRPVIGARRQRHRLRRLGEQLLAAVVGRGDPLQRGLIGGGVQRGAALGLDLPRRRHAGLFAILIFCNEVKGKSMLALSRDLGTSYKTSFVLAHKLREAMADEMRGRTLGGEGIVAEIDGMYAGGSIRPANYKKDRVDRRRAENQNGKRRVVVVIRERGGKTLPGVFNSEADVLAFIRARVAKETVLHADEASGWNVLHERYTLHRINHLVSRF